MKILQVVPYFPPAYAFGGPVRAAYQVSRELVKRKHEVVVYTSDAKDHGTRLKIESDGIVDGIEVHYFRNLLLILSGKLKFFMTPQLVSHARKEVKKFDVIHLHEFRSFQNIVVGHYAKKYGVPYVLQTHGSLRRIIEKQRLKLVYDMFFGYELLMNASKAIALSQTEAQQYKSVGVPPQKIEVIPNGIDLSKYINLPPKGSFKRKFGIEEDEKIVLYLGRIHKSKSLDLLAESFNIVARKYEKVRLVVVGPDDGFAATFSRLISALGIKERVLLTGFVEEEDKLAALVDSDVFVTPNFYGFPITFLEACLAGCPLVTTTGELDWIHENVGYVVEKSSIGLAEAISNILQNESVHRKFHKNCRGAIKNFDISTIARRLEDTYEAVANQTCG